MSIADTLRATRNEKLDASDKEMMELLDSASSWSDFNTKRTALKTYRQALRDLPTKFPTDMEETEEVPEMPLSPTQQEILDKAGE
mgnify:CR=1 FL=1|tara:strand:+ start:374 stop:628 length:255 start_codon:yes stop_codon:yes gene_type:complete